MLDKRMDTKIMLKSFNIVARKILFTFDVRDCFYLVHTFFVRKVK